MVLSDTHQVFISQQMSRVIALDVAVVAQKVKVRCYRGPVCLEKVGAAAAGSLVGRDGY